MMLPKPLGNNSSITVTPNKGIYIQYVHFLPLTAEELDIFTYCSWGVSITMDMNIGRFLI